MHYYHYHQWRKAVKRPSEWLRILCKEWVILNDDIARACDDKFMQYKPYLKGLLTSQLLCRLSIPAVVSNNNNNKEGLIDGMSGGTTAVDFWRILGITDEFDKAYIVAQVERFCAMYNIRGLPESTDHGSSEGLFAPDPLVQHQHQHHQHAGGAADAMAAASGLSVSPGGGGMEGISHGMPPPYNLDHHQHHHHHTTTAVASPAAPQEHHQHHHHQQQQQQHPSVIDGVAGSGGKQLTKKQVSEVSRAQRLAKDAEKALEQERRQNMKKEQKRLSQERKEHKQREREALAQRKAMERVQRESSREDRRKKKLEIREEREKFAQQQKELALKRAAELVASNRVPIEITRGAAAAKAAANAALVAGGHQPVPEPVVQPQKKVRSAIVVSTAADLHQIVTHSKNLWAKYNAIAKEHNQKVNWITVAKELGIHVKVREKYARMHSRAEQRGFDWEKCGFWKIKDHPEIFVEPTESEQKAKMPPPPPDTTTTVLIAGNREVQHHPNLSGGGMAAEHHSKEEADEAVAAAARVVDAAGVSTQHVDTVVSPTEEQTAAAAAVAAATLVADPTANLMQEESFQEHMIKTQTLV